MYIVQKQLVWCKQWHYIIANKQWIANMYTHLYQKNAYNFVF